MSSTVTDRAGRAPRAIAPAWHTCVLVAIQILLVAGEMRGSHPAPPPPAVPFYLGAMAFEAFLFAWVWWGLRLRGHSLAVLVARARPAAPGRDVLAGIAIWIVWYVAESLLALALSACGLTNAGAAGTAFPHGTVQSVLWIVLAAISGVSEELAFRGYLLRQFSAWTGSTNLGIVLQALLFGLGHFYLGFRQVVLITVSGALLGIFAVRLRNLRPIMVTHAWADIFGGLILRGLPY